MNLLLDTHILIWALENNPLLSSKARDAIIEGNNIIFVSTVSVWEISIKKAMGKLQVPDNLYIIYGDLNDFITQLLNSFGPINDQAIF